MLVCMSSFILGLLLWRDSERVAVVRIKSYWHESPRCFFILQLLSKLINFHMEVLNRAEFSVNGSVKTQIRVSKMHYSSLPQCK